MESAQGTLGTRTDPKYNEANETPYAFMRGDIVVKDTGDYNFRGIVVGRFRKRSGTPRYVVENEDGILHILNDRQLWLERGVV